MDLENYIIGQYEIGLSIDYIADCVHDRINNSYYKRFKSAYKYISFGRLTKTECKKLVIDTILAHIRKKDETIISYR